MRPRHFCRGNDFDGHGAGGDAGRASMRPRHFCRGNSPLFSGLKIKHLRGSLRAVPARGAIFPVLGPRRLHMGLSTS